MRANQMTETIEFHWLRALAMFDVTGSPAILSGIETNVIKGSVDT